MFFNEFILRPSSGIARQHVFDPPLPLHVLQFRAPNALGGGIALTPARTGKPGKPRLSEAEKQAEELAAANFPGLPARVVAATMLAEVAGAGHALDERFGGDDLNPKLAALEPRDRALARSIATVALRRLGTIRHALGKLLDRGLPKGAATLEWVLVAGAAQILFLDVPDHAAVDLAVRAVRLDPKTAAFAALVNGVLRNLARERETLIADCTPIDTDTPAWLAARWRKTYGTEQAAEIARMHGLEPTLDLSVKSDAEGWAKKLGGIVLPTGSVRLLAHTPVIELEGFAEGEWWVQDAAAALPARLLAPAAGMRVADLCAAPGGKCAQLAAMGAQVVAVDRSAERLKRLALNLERLKLTAESLVADAANVKAQPFDAILVDAPCTATGTIRRHPDVAWTKRSTDIASLALLQSRILDHAARLLKQGGRMVYCTCSLEPEEGEMQISALLRRNPDLMRDPILAGEIAGIADCINAQGELRTLPFHLPGSEPRLSGLDGFFAARLVRR